MEDRFRQCVEYLKTTRQIFNDTDLARILGKQKSYISEVLSKKRPMSEQFVRTFCDKFPQLSADWIISGNGNMLNSSRKTTPSQTFPTKADKNVNIQDVPLYDFGASAGLVEIFNKAGIIPIDFLRIPNLPPVDGAVYVRGDSMSPLLKSGDIVLYKKKELSISSIIWGEIYILSFLLDNDSYTAVKYIRKSDAPGMVTLASFNPDFAPMDIPMSTITALALVKASVSFHTME